MKQCRTCAYYAQSIERIPCKSCHDESNWQPEEYIAELIEAAELKAFEAGWEKGTSYFDEYGEIGGIEMQARADYEHWKEEIK